MSALLSAMAAAAQGRNVGEYNIQSGIGLKGYDPVSYFPEGGGQPQMGQPDFQLEDNGVVISFPRPKTLISSFNLIDEPTYGGWRAYAMASGSKVDIQPMIYTIHGNRLHFLL